MHNEELHNSCSPSDVVRILETTRMRQTKIAYVEKCSVGRTERRWEDNIEMGPKESGEEGVDWIQLAQDRGQWVAFVNTVMNIRSL
jgi:hypothetical protein